MNPGDVLKLPQPENFSFREILWFLDRRYDDCLYELFPGEVRRLVKIGSDSALISINREGRHLVVKVLTGSVSQEQLRNYVVRWFDLDRDLGPYYQLLQNSDLGYMVSEFSGLRMVGIPDVFEALCWCIIGQQINLTFAYTIKRRFVEAYGQSLEFEDRQYHTFPSPQQLEVVSMSDLKEMQFSRQKADYILNLAEVFRRGEVSYQSLADLEYEDQRKRLLGLRGIGDWTANYVLMKTFGDTQSIPFGDVGLFKALENHGVITDRKDRKKIEQFFEQFPGWGSYVTIYLWRSLSEPNLK